MKIGGTEINDVKIGNTSIKKVYKGVNLSWISDSNARTFISATGITDSTQQSAINQFVLDLKAINSIQSNFVNFTTPSSSVIKALYPFVGGSTTSHKFNLINPADSDSAFRLTFYGTITHDSLGVKGDGTSGYFDTHLVPSIDLDVNSAFISHYGMGGPITSGRYSFGIRTGTEARLFFTGYATAGIGHMWNSTAEQGYISSVSTWQYKKGLQFLNRYGGNYSIGTNGIKSVENSNSGGTLPTSSIKGLALDNSGAVSLFDDRRYGLMIIGTGLSSEAIVALNTACDNFQINLQRYPTTNTYIYDGDSMTYGLREGCTSPYPNQLVAKFSSFNIINPSNNYGVSGQKLSDMIADVTTQVDVNYDASKDNNIVFIWGGVNDLGLELSITAEEVYNRLKTYCQGRKAVGFKVYAFTMLPQSVSTYASRVTYETDRQTFNNLVRTDLVNSGYVDGIVDIAADSRIGLSGCENDTTYFLVDKIHMNNTGYGIVADIVYNSIIGLYDSP